MKLAVTAGEEKSLPIRFLVAVVGGEIDSGHSGPSPQVVAGPLSELNFIAIFVLVAASAVHKELCNEETDGRSAHTREQPVHVLAEPAAAWDWGPAGVGQRVAAEWVTRAEETEFA